MQKKFRSRILIAAAVSFALGHEAQAAGLIGQWSFDGNANDSAGSANLSYFGSPTFVPGVAGNAIHFNGFTRAETASLPLPPTGPVTISYWFNATSWDTPWANGVLLTIGGSFNPLFLQDENAALRLYASTDVAGVVSPGGVDLLGTGSWHHIAYSSSGTQVKTYLDGSLASTVSLNPSFGPRNLLFVGSYPGTFSPTQPAHPFNGSIDELQIYDTALGASAIQDLFTHPAPVSAVPEAGSVGFWAGSTGLIGWFAARRRQQARRRADEVAAS